VLSEQSGESGAQCLVSLFGDERREVDVFIEGIAARLRAAAGLPASAGPGALVGLALEDLTRAYKSVATGMTTFGPVVDGAIVPAQPFSQESVALSGDKPLIMGDMDTEASLFLFTRREEIEALGRDGIEKLVNDSVNQTLARTINTTLTTLFPVIALCVWGGPVLQAFSYAMLVGIIAGTYSSMFVATGALIEWYKARPESR